MSDGEAGAKRYFVRGRVQGVFFRDSTRNEARTLGISGHANNLPDGTVEVLACGARADVAKLGEWLKVGPPAANVSGVDSATLDVGDCSQPDGFTCGQAATHV
jgi:acylphosphatase